MRATGLDSSRHPAVPKFARKVLARTLGAMQFDPNAFARGERLRRVRSLLSYPDPDVARRAAALSSDADAWERRKGRSH